MASDFKPSHQSFPGTSQVPFEPPPSDPTLPDTYQSGTPLSDAPILPGVSDVIIPPVENVPLQPKKSSVGKTGVMIGAFLLLMLIPAVVFFVSNPENMTRFLPKASSPQQPAYCASLVESGGCDSPPQNGLYCCDSRCGKCMGVCKDCNATTPTVKPLTVGVTSTPTVTPTPTTAAVTTTPTSTPTPTQQSSASTPTPTQQSAGAATATPVPESAPMGVQEPVTVGSELPTSGGVTLPAVFTVGGGVILLLLGLLL